MECVKSVSPDRVAHSHALALGARIRLARIRRHLRQEDLCARAGLSLTALAAVERGEMTSGLGTYLRALAALGLIEAISSVADPAKDAEGAAVEHRPALRRRVRHSPAQAAAAGGTNE